MKKSVRHLRILNECDEKEPHCVPLTQVQSPGRLLQLNKGKPAFYSQFVELFDGLKEKVALEKGEESPQECSSQEEWQDLLNIMHKMFLYYKVELHLPSNLGNLCVQVLDFSKVVIETIYSVSRELFLKSDLRHLYVFLDLKQTYSNPVFLQNQKNSLIMDQYNSNEQVVRKVQELIKNQMTKKTGPSSEESRLVEKAFSGRFSDTFRSYQESFRQSCFKNKTNATTTLASVMTPPARINPLKTFMTNQSSEVSLDDGLQFKLRRKLESPRVIFGGISYASTTSTTSLRF